MNGASYEWAMRVRDFDLANRGECDKSATKSDSKRVFERLGEIIEGVRYVDLWNEASFCRNRIGQLMNPPVGINPGSIAGYMGRLLKWADGIISRADLIDNSMDADLANSLRILGTLPRDASGRFTRTENEGA